MTRYKYSIHECDPTIANDATLRSALHSLSDSLILSLTLFFACTSDPRSSRSWHVSRWLFLPAQCRGVQPSWKYIHTTLLVNKANQVNANIYITNTIHDNDHHTITHINASIHKDANHACNRTITIHTSTSNYYQTTLRNNNNIFTAQTHQTSTLLNLATQHHN